MRGNAVLACLGIVASLVGCSGPHESARTQSSPLVGGTASDSSQNEVVLIIHHSTTSELDHICSGTLLAPNLVLTARHCVAVADSTSQCASDETSLSGGRVYEDYDPQDLYVFAGAQRPAASLASVTQRGSAILDDGSSTLCNHDIALIVLATPVPDAKIAPVRLDRAPAANEPVTLVGWGLTDATAGVPTTRQQRVGESVLAVGPADGLGPSELVVGEGPCGGDSGGPALVASGAVIGALSRGGNGVDEGGVDACIGGQSIYTEVAGFRDLLLSAYERAGTTPWLESGPAPPAAEVTNDGGGCSAAPGEGSGAAAAVALGAALLCALRRRATMRSFPPRRSRGTLKACSLVRRGG